MIGGWWGVQLHDSHQAGTWQQGIEAHTPYLLALVHSILQHWCVDVSSMDVHPAAQPHHLCQVTPTSAMLALTCACAEPV
jgi:hypothetical protein